MPWFFRLFALLTVVAASGCTFGREPGALMREIHPPIPTDQLDRPLSADEVQRDLAFLLQTLDEVHPGAFTQMPRAAFVQALDSLGGTVDGTQTRLDLFLALQPVVARLRDGHTSVVYPSEERTRARESGAVFFPIRVALREGQIIARSQAGGVAVGDTISAIDGVSGAEWTRYVSALRSGESQAMQEAHAERWFPWLVALTDRDGSPFRVTVGDRTESLAPVPSDTLTARRRAAQPGARWSYRTQPDGVGVLTLRSFSGDLPTFLDGAVADARRDSARGLVVDLRDNPGGDSRNVQALVARITDQPYRLMSRSEHRRSDQYGRRWPQEFIGSPFLRGMLRVVPVHRLHPVSRGYYATPVGENQTTEMPLTEPAPPPPPQAERFVGPVAVVTSRYSASASVVFAAVVQDHDLGTVVGEETGEWATMHGEAYYTDLPHSRLLVGVSTYRLVRPSGDDGPGGVVPDVPVAADGALDHAVRVILYERQH